MELSWLEINVVKRYKYVYGLEPYNNTSDHMGLDKYIMGI
jgi:hypothetical protein